MIRIGDYGPVLVIGDGRWKGKVGYYDDDDKGFACVYFHRPFGPPAARLPHVDLAPTDVIPEAVARWCKTYPVLAQSMGVILKREQPHGEQSQNPPSPEHRDRPRIITP